MSLQQETLEEEKSECLHFVKCRNSATAPTLGSDGAAGYDLYAAEHVTIMPNTRIKVAIGLKMKIPAGYCGRICSRSSVALKQGIDVVAGVIDEDYRGEVLVGLHSTRPTPYKFEIGDRIAQMLILKVHKPELVEVQELDETLRGEGGFGSTGV